MAKESQQSLFPDAPQPLVKNCVRCAKRCRVVDKANPNAQLFVKGDMKTGRFCTECLIVDFFKNFDYGGYPLMEMLDRKDKPFDPECFRLPHVQDQFGAIVVAAQKQFGAELSPEEIDWDEVIANWHLPFPEKPGRKKKR